jgi:hypothetical protein
MTLDKILAVTLLLLIGAGTYSTSVGAANGTSAVAIAVNAPPASPAGRSPSLPPPRVQDCVTFTLLDDMCTKQWYSCKRGASELSGCVDAWETCCTLRGQGARSRLGSAQPVTADR